MDQPVPATFLRAARARTRTIAVGVLVGGLGVGSGSAIAASTTPAAPESTALSLAAATTPAAGAPAAQPAEAAPSDGAAAAPSDGPAAPAPAPPAPAAPAPAKRVDVQPATTSEDAERDAAVEAFFDAGYAYDDALAIAAAWGIDAPDLLDLKVKAGRLLVEGETLPVAPGSAPDAPVPTDGLDAARAAFFDAGYTYDHAVELAALWGGDTWDAKATAGRRLLDGQTLPVQP